MAIGLFEISRKLRVVLSLTLALMLLSGAATQAQDASDSGEDAADVAAEEKSAEQNKSGDTEEDAASEEEPDPFAIPTDATADELFSFIRDVKRKRGRTLESVMKSARAATDAADIIRKMEDVELSSTLRAITEQVSALGFLSRYDTDAKEQLETLIEELSLDERPEVAKVAATETFKMRIGKASEATADEQLQLISDLKALVGDDGLDRSGYSLASSLARAIGYSPNTELAASLYEDMAEMMSESSDESLRSRAGKMVGAARRMRLPGNFMEVMGTTTEGETFDWDAYRGKVVLVDFWASWCGPCRREVPNMKRNLELYGEKGFEIVGVNLDRTRKACEKYVEQEELAWPNLMSDEDGQRGWDNPLATHYGISAIPTAILVDQDGVVVSLKARGEELDRLLAELLGEPVTQTAEVTEQSETEEGAS